MKYIIISSRETESDIATSMVMLKVNEYIKKGFVPNGNLSIIFDQDNRCYAAQVMIKYDEEDIPGLTPYIGNMEEKG